MKSSFLLILSLITGCEVKTCKEGWVQFTCNRGKTKGTCTMYHLVEYRPTIKENTFNLTIYKTNFQPSSGKQDLVFEVEKNVCPKPFYQNVNKTENTTIRCDSPHKHQSYFFCKQSNSSCIDVLSGKSSSKYTGTNRDKGFNVSISAVSLQDGGVYWCGIKSNDNKYNFLLKQIQLKVIVNFRRSLMIGQNFSYWCKYDDDSLLTKFICKGDDPSTCQPLVNTTNTEMNMKFSMTDNKQKKNISITMREVTVNDSGTYWCGSESTDRRRFFIHKLSVTVVSPTPATSTVSSSAETTAAAWTHSEGADGDVHGVSEAVFSVIICAAVLLSLLLLIVLILIYKRFSCSKTTGNRTDEDCTYEEIQERLQLPEPALNTIYVTVNPPSHAASTHYATINFQNWDKAGGEALKPSSSACHYSTVKFTKCPTSSSVTPLQTAEEPLYSTVNKSLKK